MASIFIGAVVAEKAGTSPAEMVTIELNAEVCAAG